MRLWTLAAYLYIIALAACLAVLVEGCSGQASDASVGAGPPPTPVRVETVARERVVPTLVVPGIVEAESRIELAFRVEGFVARFAVEEGERVEAGDLIAELDLADLERAVRTARAELERARARAAEAELSFDRAERLVALASTSQQRFEAARMQRDVVRAEVRRARLEVEAAQQRLAHGTLRAPIAGYIERRLIEEHEHASARAPVVILTGLDVVIVRGAVSDSAVARLRPGDAALVRSAAWPERRFEGRIRRIDVAADHATRTVPFEVSLANPDLALRPEMGVDVEIPVGAAEPVCSVPLAAVLRGLDAQPFCFVVEAEGGAVQRALRRPLELGPVHGDRVAISAGLSPGYRVVIRGQHFLRGEDRVRIVGGAP